MKSEIVVALTGNPNAGKSTVFNVITGARQHVGNYPGVTVERKEGKREYAAKQYSIIDLPGTYSLTAYSLEERIARDFIQNDSPDVVVDVLDASNFDRNMYLAVQLMEMNAPLILALNMVDMATARGMLFDTDKLSRLLNVPVVETVGNKGEGIDDLLEAIHRKVVQNETPNLPQIDYGQTIEDEITAVIDILKKDSNTPEGMNYRWVALKLLENDSDIKERYLSPEIASEFERRFAALEEKLEDHPEIVIANRRYDFITELAKETIKSTDPAKRSVSDKIDSVVTNRVLGIPIFLVMMYLMFQLTFTLGDPLMGWIETFFEWLGGTVEAAWPEGNMDLMRSLVLDGIIGGVGGVVVFLPNILLLFLAISLLEASGYMARVAFIMDRIMHKIGLCGKSFIPMLIGFGCSIPAVMATRTLDNQRDRITTMMVIPYMSCGARLPIYALIIPAFFPQMWQAPMLWLIYIIGIVMAILMAKILNVTVLKGESTPFVMELPPYRVPTIGGTLRYTFERGWIYLKRAGTIILAISIVLWAMATFPGISDEATEKFEAARETVEAQTISDADKEAALEEIDNQEAELALRQSLSGRMGKAMEPVIQTMGFDWKIGTALVGGLAAKEVVVAQLGVVYSMGEVDEESETLREKLQATYTPFIGFCLMLFCLMSAPCIATLAIVRRESNSWKWSIGQFVGLTVVAYIVTTLVYQIGIRI